MQTEQNDIIRAAKIIGASIIVAAGGIGIILVHPTGVYVASDAAPVAYFTFILGLWLLNDAWTTRTMVERLRSLFRVIAGPQPDTHAAPTAATKETGSV